MKTTHTFWAVRSGDRTEPQTRTSKSRDYQACLVYTVTERSVELALARKAKWEAELAQANADLTHWCQTFGMTVEKAQEWERRVVSAWHDKWFEASEEVRAALHRPHAHVNEIRANVDSLLESRGMVNPYAPGTPHEITHLTHVVTGLRQSLAGWELPIVGNEYVMSWHLTVGNAQAARERPENKIVVERLGHALSVRTDITRVAK